MERFVVRVLGSATLCLNLCLGVWLSFCASALGAETPGVSLRLPPVSGEPGEEVALEFHAKFLGLPAQIHLRDFSITMKALAPTLEPVRADTDGTVLAGVPRRAVYATPFVFEGSQGAESLFVVGFTSQDGVEVTQAQPESDVLLLKAIFRIAASAPPHSRAIEVLYACFIVNGLVLNDADVEGSPAIEVQPPIGPRPVGGLGCHQEKAEAVLSWTLTEQDYDGVIVWRQGEVVATLPGSATGFRETPPLGRALYTVQAARGGKGSIPAPCEMTVEPVRPAAIRDLACTPSGGAMKLSWTNGQAYEAITVFRNGSLVASLEGSAQSFSDEFRSSLFTLYVVEGWVGGVATVPASCQLNVESDYVMWAEEASAFPGAQLVPLRIFGTHPANAYGLSVCLRIDPARVRIRGLSIAGTSVEATGYDFFDYSELLLEKGLVNAGVVFDMTPPLTNFLPIGTDQHILTVLFDVLGDAREGTSVPVELGDFPLSPEGPIGRNMFALSDGMPAPAKPRSAWILVGQSPVPPVEGAVAEEAGEEAPAEGAAPLKAAQATAAIRLRWVNPTAYDSIRIERDAAALGEIAGDRTSYIDEGPGPGIHRYRIYGKKDGVESFPVIVTTVPPAVPGTFLRGDVDSDRRIRITDAVVLLVHLFRGGAEPGCLDAADANDDGKLDLTDAVAILAYLFRGAGALPPPGPKTAWFDPTEDGLSCGAP